MHKKLLAQPNMESRKYFILQMTALFMQAIEAEIFISGVIKICAENEWHVGILFFQITFWLYSMLVFTFEKIVRLQSPSDLAKKEKIINTIQRKVSFSIFKTIRFIPTDGF